MKKTFCDRCNDEIDTEATYYRVEVFPENDHDQLDPDVEFDLCAKCQDLLMDFFLLGEKGN